MYETEANIHLDLIALFVWSSYLILEISKSLKLLAEMCFVGLDNLLFCVFDHKNIYDVTLLQRCFLYHSLWYNLAVSGIVGVYTDSTAPGI